ncbi:MAG: hypothetical protein ACYC8S_00780 [Minisyncoccota bacterium]
MSTPMTPRRIIRILLILFVVTLVVGYSLFAFFPFMKGPQLSLYSPQNGSTATTSLVTVQGNAQGVSYLYLNDRQIFTDAAGMWSEPLLLAPGYNILVVRARDRFGRTTQKTLQLISPQIASSSLIISN